MTIRGRLRLWRCTCSCGNEVIACGSELTRGDTQSCGCLRADRSRESQRKRRQDLTNKPLKHGGYVIGPSDVFKTRKSGDRYNLWRCQCPCGTEFLAIASKIQNGRKSFCSRTCPRNTRKRIPKPIEYAKLRTVLAKHDGYKRVAEKDKTRITLAAANGDKRAAELLVMMYDQWIWKAARKHAASHRVKGELVIEELVQECRIALLKAAERWDPSRGAFTTCAQWWLRHAMGREPNSGTSGIEVPANAHKAEGTRAAAIRAHRMLSLDVPIGNDADVMFKDTLEAPHEEAEFAPEDLDALPELIKRLPDAQRFAIERYYLADKTLQEVGDERGVTRARIGQLVDAGVAKLKRWMAQRERA